MALRGVKGRATVSRGVKRPATAVAPSAQRRNLSKKNKVCVIVAEALIGQPTVETESLCRMLASMVGTSVGVYKDARIPRQQEVVDRMAQVLGAKVELLRADIDSAQALQSGAEDDKERQTSSVAESRLQIRCFKEVIADKKAACNSALPEVVAADKALEAALEFQKKEEKTYDALASRQDKIDKARMAFAEAGNNKCDTRSIRELQKVCKSFGVDSSTLIALHEVFNKEPDARGPFDSIITNRLGEELTRLVAEQAEAVTAAKLPKAACAEKVIEARAAQKDAKEALVECEEALAVARSDLETEEATLAEAQQAARALAEEVKISRARCVAAVAALAAFQRGPMAAFQGLRDRQASWPHPRVELDKFEPVHSEAEALAMAPMMAEEPVDAPASHEAGADAEMRWLYPATM